MVTYYSLLVPANAHILLYMYFTFSGCYMFRLVAILRELATKYISLYDTMHVNVQTVLKFTLHKCSSNQQDNTQEQDPIRIVT